MIDEDLVARLTPEILRLQSASREPISVYIDSRGGIVYCMESILRLLKLTDQDASPPCRIITAVTSLAASAAADLLSSGDYAVAYPSTKILYHGLRTLEKNPLTLELTSTLANSLRAANDTYAMKLAEQINRRFLFRFIMARHGFVDIREKNCTPNMTDLECFIEIIKSQLSAEAKNVLEKARIRHGRYEKLLDTVFRKSRRSRGKKTLAQLEANHIKAIIAFEVKNNEGDLSWSFTNRGMSSLVDDFFLWNEYLDDFGSARLPEWSSMYARWTVPPEKLREIEAIEDKKSRADKFVEAVGPILEPISAFFVALCHTLQEGENVLTASDAYWLGIVDEVVGEPLPTERWMAEYREDPKPQDHAQD
jgi:hypothetical protein